MRFFVTDVGESYDQTTPNLFVIREKKLAEIYIELAGNVKNSVNSFLKFGYKRGVMREHSRRKAITADDTEEGELFCDECNREIK